MDKSHSAKPEEFFRIVFERNGEACILEHDLRVSAAAFDGSREAMFITDPDAVILKVNTAFTTLTGYSRKDAVGQTPRMLRSGRQGPEFCEAMWKDLKEKKTWRGELWNRRKDGEFDLESLNINAVTDHAGRVTSSVAAFTQVTARSRVEDARRQKEGL